MNNRFSTNLLAAGAMTLLRPAAAFRRRGRTLPDGTRAMAAVNLRGEAAKFALSALGLKVEAPDAAAKFKQFLREEPTLRWSLDAGRHAAPRRHNPFADVGIATFNTDGSLQSVEPRLEGLRGDGLLDAVAGEIVKAYNRSRHEDDVARPERIVYEWTLAVEHHAPWPASGHALAHRLALRVLRATWVSFEDNGDRFTAPDFHRRKAGGLGALNVVIRPAPEGCVDLWIQCHHAALDGGPVQDALKRLSDRWGKDAGVRFPGPGTSAASPRACGFADGRRIERTQDWVDFAPLLAARKAIEARLDTAITGRPHLSAILLWHLARQPEFAGRRFSLAVELAASKTDERTFGFLPIRPADYFEGPAGPRLSAYVREFNRLLTLTRRRQSPAYRAMGQLALLPAPLRARSMSHNRAHGERLLGTFGVSILRDAEAFLAPMADVGFNDGFLAVGNMNLPTAARARVGCATFAAPAGVAGAYPAALRRAIEECIATDI